MSNSNPITAKTCSHCKQTLEISFFHKNKSRKDEFAADCKQCKARHESAKDFSKMSSLQRQKAREANRRWMKKNAESELARKQEYRLNNPEKELLRHKRWREQNRGSANAQDAKRRSSLVSRTPNWLTAEDLEQIGLVYMYTSAWSAATKTDHQVDHIVPLQGAHVSGLHVPWNLQILTAKENARKNNRMTSQL